MSNLTLLVLKSAETLGRRVDTILTEWYGEEDLLTPVECPRFGSGEGKAVIPKSVRDKDIYVVVDVCNNSLTYKMDGMLNRMSPDDHFQDLKRVISACNGTARRITVIMPFLYEGRQHRRVLRESMDCAMMLQELERMGVHGIITFDAHDPRMQNAIPLTGLENVSPALQFTQSLLSEYEDLCIDQNHLMFIAPDEGATGRVVFFASVFGVNIGMFYKRRDYSTVVDGLNPIVAHDFCGQSVDGKDCIVVDDMISSGGSILDVSKQLKDLGARRVFVFSTFGLFTNGFEKFDTAYRDGLFDRVFTTNLIYQKPDLLQKPWYCSVNMGRYIAALIDTLHRGDSIQELTMPARRIRETIELYRKH